MGEENGPMIAAGTALFVLFLIPVVRMDSFFFSLALHMRDGCCRKTWSSGSELVFENLCYVA
jgi:hypothetical protein